MIKKKVLFVANMDLFFYKFLIPYLKWYHENNYEVHIASNGEDFNIPYCDKKYNVSFCRKINSFDNIKSYFQMKKIIQGENYEVINCHTPFGGAIARLAAKKLFKKGKIKVIYTAHGFHFFKGSSKKCWKIFYPVERYLAKFTTALITINNEDYELAKNNFKTNVFFVNGIGIDENKFNFKTEDNKKLKKELGIKSKDFIIIYTAELSKRKNQEWLIKTLANFIKDHKDVKLLLPGNDCLNGYLQNLVNDLNLSKQVLFLGFRKDIPQLLRISSLAVSASMQEGLPVNIMEEMYYGMPIIATDCRGNRDLIIDGYNGYLVKQNDSKTFVKRVNEIYFNKYDKKIIENSKKKVNDYLLSNVSKKIFEIYEGIEKND